MSQDGPEESAVADFLQILEEHRKNCERQGKYVEAEIAKNRLEELKMHEENRRKEALSRRPDGRDRRRRRARGTGLPSFLPSFSSGASRRRALPRPPHVA